MTRTAWTATREELVAALQRARIDAATAQAVAAELEAKEAARKARRREEDQRRRERAAAGAQAAAVAAYQAVPPDPNAAYHRWVLEQALTDRRSSIERKASA